jgi:hypothetical protein
MIIRGCLADAGLRFVLASKLSSGIWAAVEAVHAPEAARYLLTYT